MGWEAGVSCIKGMSFVIEQKRAQQTCTVPQWLVIRAPWKLEVAVSDGG